MLANLSVKDFLAKTAGNEPIPGGGSVSALCAGLGAALARMVTNLTIGREKYKDNEDKVIKLAERLDEYREQFLKNIDDDADAYHRVFSSFKLPRETDEEKRIRSEKIQETTIYAAEVPLKIAHDAYKMMALIEDVARYGNSNAITDVAVAMMTARTAVLGAALNVRINLGSIKDEKIVGRMSAEVEELETNAVEREQRLIKEIKQKL